MTPIWIEELSEQLPTKVVCIPTTGTDLKPKVEKVDPAKPDFLAIKTYLI